MLTFRENVAMLRTSRDEALTDALTGLGNRRALARELAELLPEADDARPVVLVLFDLDGFKHYNDTFGHPAGDALLVRLGANLATYLSGRGRAFRMGGDEFCALFEPGRRGRRPDHRGRRVRADRARRGLQRHLLLRRDRAPARGAGRDRGAADRRPAHVRAEERGADVGDAPVARTCSCAR